MRFVTSFFALLLTVHAVILAFNVWDDGDGRLWRGYPEESSLALRMLQGHDLAGPQQMRSRALAAEMIRQATVPPQAVVLGSSRTLLIGEALLGVKGIRNHSISSARLPDYLGVIGLYHNQGVALSKVIIGADAWIFKDEKINVAPLEPGVRAVARRVGVDVGGLGLDEAIPWRSYFSLKKAQTALARRGVGEGPCAELRDLGNEDSPCPVKRHDGTLRYPLEVRSRPAEAVDDIVRIGARGGMPTFHDYRQLDPGRVEAFERVLTMLKQLGSDVLIVLVPYHPIVENFNRDRKDGKLAVAAERVIREVAAKVDFPVVGSYSAARAGCRNDEFYDADHPKESCMRTILAPAVEAMFPSQKVQKVDKY